MKRLFIGLTVASLATMLVSVSARDGRLAFDTVGNLFVADGQAGAYNNRGNAKGAAGDLDGAIADYNHALQLDPKLAEAYYNRAATPSATKATWMAPLPDYTRAIELNPKHALERCRET